MPINDPTGASRTSLKMLSLVLDALGPFRQTADPIQFCGLPTPAFMVPPCRLLIAATPCDAPAFGQAIRGAALLGRHDVLLIRHGLHPEILDPVHVDIVMARAGPATVFQGMLPFIDRSNGLWMIPPASHRGHSIQITDRGVRIGKRKSFADTDERHAGLIRAARSILLRMRSR